MRPGVRLARPAHPTVLALCDLKMVDDYADEVTSVGSVVSGSPPHWPDWAEAKKPLRGLIRVAASAIALRRAALDHTVHLTP
jgi:hypothetical protein